MLLQLKFQICSSQAAMMDVIASTDVGGGNGTEDSPTQFEEDVSTQSGAKTKRDYVKTMKGKRKAEYWEGFDMYRDENNHQRASCKLCKKTYACDSNKNGTKNVRNHYYFSCLERTANQGSLYVTSNFMLLHVRQAAKVLNQMAMHDDRGFRAMSTEMIRKCNKYWGELDKMNMLMFVALILDLFYKLRGVQVAITGIFGQENAENLLRKVKSFAYELFDEYKSVYAPLNSESGESLSRPSTIEEDDNSSWLAELNEQVTRGASHENELSRSEFDSYLVEIKGEHEEKDILTWWKLNGPRYPILARMARDILAVPISTVPSECAFSTGGRTLDQYRGSLDPSMAQALVCTGDWLQATTRNKDNHEEDFYEDLEKNCPDEVHEGTFFVSS